MSRLQLFLTLIAISASLEVDSVTCSADDREHFFETRIRPVLIEKCFKCHGSEKESSELRVDSREALIKGGEIGVSVIPGKPAESLLLQAIDPANEDIQMPPDDPLPASVVADFAKWIGDGASWPALPSDRPDEAFLAGRHWAFRPVSKPAPPNASNTDWIRNPVDRFVLKQLDEAGLRPADAADRATLLRRLKFDLVGLPPTFEEIQAFVNDQSPQAWSQLIDRYLTSPHYGERWGRHWLDVARYADTKGYVFQEERKYPFAWTYRDWVVRSLNEDLPYDQFLIRQIAADWLVKEGLPETELAAMGFFTLGRRFLNNRHDIIDDRIDVLMRGTQALTVACARCHEHKYDPIPQEDYYSLYGIFASSHEPKDHQGAMPLFENDKQYNPYVFLRGSSGNRGPTVPRQFLEVVAGPDRKPFEKGSGRLELAHSIASPDNPLTARVIVNRIWRQHFHSSMVTTPSDFGLRCEPPTHPELLDWLAAYLIESDWSLKELHRVILNSATWRQSSLDDPEKRKIDPENRLYWRMNRGRLELEPMRDAILAVGGDLDRTLGGEAVEITKHPTPRRRTIYGFIDRQNLPGLFRTFDFAGPDTHSPGRFTTSVPPQTLFLRNSPFLADEARRIARRLPKDTSTSIRIRDLFRNVLARDPRSEDVQLAEAFLDESQQAVIKSPGGSPWQYGYGRFDQTTGRLESFTPLPYWTGTAWQGGPKLPDPTLGYATLRANSGHPGGPDRAVAWRWTAPIDATIRIAGSLKHPSEQGNGVAGILSVPSREILVSWPAKNQTRPTNSEPFHIKAGQSVDLLVDARGNNSFDSFNWAPEIHSVDNPASRWSAQAQFHGPLPRALSGWEMLAQVLLLSNEFQFVD